MKTRPPDPEWPRWRRVLWWCYFITAIILTLAVCAVCGYLAHEAMNLGM